MRECELTVLVHRSNEFVSVRGTRNSNVVLTKPSLDPGIAPRKVIVRLASDLRVVLVEVVIDLQRVDRFSQVKRIDEGRN
jgi:hypothetical protein